MKKLLNVTDLSSYLYCPRKFFIQKIKGIRPALNKAMVEGMIRHRVLENFSKKENYLIENLELINHIIPKTKIIDFYNNFLNEIIKRNFEKEFPIIQKFKINMPELKSKIFNAMENDINLRADSVLETVKKGFIGRELWEKLEPKYISEMYLLSENLGLKGKVDRVMLSKEKNLIIPYELKTRPISRVWPSDEIQLTAYAMLLEEHFQKQIPFGILESGNEKTEIPITAESKQKVIDLIKEINNLLESHPPEYPSSFSKCNSCEFGEECDGLEDNQEGEQE